MAQSGQVKFLYGPFNQNQQILNPTGINIGFKIGISIDEKDCMEWQGGELVPEDAGPEQGSSFLPYINPILVNISGQTIQIGRSFIYESGDIIDNATLSFPNGAPPSTKICIVYT